MNKNENSLHYFNLLALFHRKGHGLHTIFLYSIGMAYSVVIPTVGRSTLNRAIESALQQTVKPTEIIVVSTKKNHGSLPTNSGIRVLIASDYINPPFTAAKNRNLGIQVATSPYIAFLDDDDVWTKSKMAVQLVHLEKSGVDLSICSAWNHFASGLVLKRPFKTIKTTQSVLDIHFPSHRRLFSPYYLPTPGIVVKTGAAKQILFDPQLPYYEDIWWMHCLQVNNFRISQIPNALLHVYSDGFSAKSRIDQNTDAYFRQLLRSENPVYEKNYLSRGTQLQSLRRFING